jgi:hypothetical protein
MIGPEYWPVRQGVVRREKPCRRGQPVPAPLGWPHGWGVVLPCAGPFQAVSHSDGEDFNVPGDASGAEVDLFEVQALDGNALPPSACRVQHRPPCLSVCVSDRRVDWLGLERLRQWWPDQLWLIRGLSIHEDGLVFQ